MFGSPAQWAAAGDTAAADALVERMPNPVLAVRTLLSLVAVSDSDERTRELLQRAGAKAAPVAHVVPRGMATIAVVRAAVAARQSDVALEIAAAVETGLALHLREVCAVELARQGEVRAARVAAEGLPSVRRDRAIAAVSVEEARQAGDPEVARALADRVADAPARVSVLLAAGLVDEALAVPLSPGAMDAVGIEKADLARTELAVALAGYGDFDEAIEVIGRISGRRRRFLARRAAARSALPLPGAERLVAALQGWERDQCLADLAVRAGSVDHARAFAEGPAVLAKLAVAAARRGPVWTAMELVADLEPDTVTTLRLAEEVARHGDREMAIAMITDPAIRTPYDWENPAPAYDVVPGACAAAAHGELANVLAVVETTREWDRGAVLRRAALAAARHGHPRTALALVAQLDNGEARRHQAAVVLGATAARGQLADALALLEEHVPPHEQLYTLVVIGRALVRTGRVPATGLLSRAEALTAEADGVVPRFALAELAAIAGQVGRGVLDLPRVERPGFPQLVDHPTNAILKHVACAAAAQGRIDEALAIVEPSHALVMAAAAGGHLTAALAMAADIATKQAARKFGHSAAVHRRDLVIDICRTLAAVGATDSVIEVAQSLPPRHRDLALRLAARTAIAHGYLSPGVDLLWLTGGPGPDAAVAVAIADLDAGSTIAATVGGSRERALRELAGIAAARGLFSEAAAAVARIEPDDWTLAAAWRHVAGRLDGPRLHTFAADYLTARGSHPGVLGPA